MNADALFYHLTELNVVLSFGERIHTLEIEGPRGALTSELKGLITENKPDLIELVYEREERAAIEDEARIAEAQIRLRRAQELRDVVCIPLMVPNTLEAITKSLNAQRRGATA